MSATFTKLFSSITDSSIWCEDSDTKVVWVTMLAMADAYGRVMASVPGLAKRANVAVEKTRIALGKFMAPDPDSRTKTHEGRRIEECDGGWRLLNYDFYRELRGADDRREQNRLAQERRRNRDKSLTEGVSNQSASVSKCQQSQPPSAHVEEEVEVEEEKKSRAGKPPRLTDSEFLDSLRSTYAWLSLETELAKMDAWLLAQGGRRQKTRRFIVNWLNRVEKPMAPAIKPEDDKW